MNVTQFRAKIYEIINATPNDYSDASLIRDLNSELSMIQISILRDRGVMEYDDTNYSDIPVATFPVSGTTYKLTEDEDGSKIMTIHKVVLTVGGQDYDIPRVLIGENNQDGLINVKTAKVPKGYYEIGHSIVFTDIPEGGVVKIWFDREMSFVTTSDTTKVPGIPSSYHNLAAYRTALNYAIDKGLSNENSILRRVQMEEARLEQFEANRRGDEQSLISVDVISGI